jgi:hypothetical protein
MLIPLRSIRTSQAGHSAQKAFNNEVLFLGI